MKPNQAPIEIAKELHELNKKLDRIIDILQTLKGIVLQPTSYPINPYNPVIYQTPTKPNNPIEITCAAGNSEALSEPTICVGSLDGEPDHFITGNSEAHDYGTEYINVTKEWITPDA